MFAGDIGAEGGYGSFISIETSRNGLIYLNHQEDFAASEYEQETYYTVDNNEWIVSLTRVHRENYDFSTFTYNESEWLVNDNPVSEQVYNNAPESILEIIDVRSLPTRWTYSGNAETVYAVLSELETRAEELERVSGTDSDEYDYGPLAPGGGLNIQPEVFRRITDPLSANTAIFEAIASMTPEQRRSGDALDMAALFIEAAVRAGASTAASGEVPLSAAVLSDLAGTANGILSGAGSALKHENVGLLRTLRTNISIKTDERQSLVVSFPDDVSGVAFDNVTVEAAFASVTLNKASIRSGGMVELRMLPATDAKGAGGEGDAGDAGEPGTGGQPPGNGSGKESASGGSEGSGSANNGGASGSSELSGSASGGNATGGSTSGGSAGGLLDNFNPLDFWSAGVVALIFVVWGVLAALKHRFRAWVVPTFCALAIAINACTYFLPDSDAAKSPDAARPPSSADGGNELAAGGSNAQANAGKDNEQAGTGKDNAQTGGDDFALDTGIIEVIMSEGVRATVSLPAVGGEKDYLVLLDESGAPQYSKYNPVTDTVDTRIRESGIYTLKEYAVSFIDVEQKNDLMKEAISQLASRGIMAGTTDGFFFPDKPINRAELVSAIVRAFDLLDPEAVSRFADLSRSDWYYAAAATAEREGIISGFEDNTFRGETDIPKDQLVAITGNTLVERMGYIVPVKVEDLLAVFKDRKDIAAWSEDRIALAAQSNILIYRTDSLFAPRSIMTRGDAAIILFRVFNKVW